MLEGPNTWKDALLLFQSKVSTAVGKHSLKKLHECEIITQANKHVDSMFALKLFERRFILKHAELQSGIQIPCFACNI